MNTKWRIVWLAIAFIAIVLIGTAGYMLIEGWGLMDSIYMTFITLSTVGFKEVYDLSTAGRVFTIFLIICGTGTMLYTVSTIVQSLLEGNLASILGRRLMKGKISNLKNHVILCGYGKVGKEVARVFQSEGTPFVIIEADEQASALATKNGFLVVNMNATNDEALKEAGVMDAQSLVSALGSDADNLYVTLSAKSLKPDIFIVSRVDSEESESKLKRAGADRTMSPYGIGGRRLAMLTLKPLVVDFIDGTLDRQGLELTLENVEVMSGSAMVGITVKEGMRRASGGHILAIKKKSGRLITSPPEDMVIETGDQLVLMGTREQLKGLDKLT